jgi:hypothetical protein
MDRTFRALTLALAAAAALGSAQADDAGGPALRLRSLAATCA